MTKNKKSMKNTSLSDKLATLAGKKSKSPKKASKSPKKTSFPPSELLERIKTLYTTEGKDAVKEAVKESLSSDDIDIEMLDTGRHCGLPHQPKQKPFGTYYKTDPQDFVYAPVLPSDSTAKVSAAPDPKPDLRQEARRNRSRQAEKAIAELKELTKSYIETLNTEEAGKIISWIAELRSWNPTESVS